MGVSQDRGPVEVLLKHMLHPDVADDSYMVVIGEKGAGKSSCIGRLLSSGNRGSAAPALQSSAAAADTLWSQQRLSKVLDPSQDEEAHHARCEQLRSDLAATGRVTFVDTFSGAPEVSNTPCTVRYAAQPFIFAQARNVDALRARVFGIVNDAIKNDEVRGGRGGRGRRMRFGTFFQLRLVLIGIVVVRGARI